MLEALSHPPAVSTVYTAGARCVCTCMMCLWLLKVCTAQCFCMLTVCFLRVQLASAYVHTWISTHTHSGIDLTFIILLAYSHTFTLLHDDVAHESLFWVSMKWIYCAPFPFHLWWDSCESRGLVKIPQEREDRKELTFTAGFSHFPPSLMCTGLWVHPYFP